MNIIIIFDTGRVGGHVVSALTTAYELKRKGHQLTVISGKGDFVPEIATDIDYFQIPFFHFYRGRQTYFSLQSWKTVSALKEHLAGKKIDMIHAFDARSYLVGFLVSFLWNKIPLSGTICGGCSPYYNLPYLAALIVFSDEQKYKMKEVFHWPDQQVRVIRTRLNMENFIKNDSSIITEYKKFNIDPAKKNIMMISTFLTSKVNSLKATFKAIRIVCEKYADVNFVFIGGRGDFYDEAQKIVISINQDLNRQAIILTGVVPNAYRLLRHSYIVFGQGRSAFEGMAFGKPTIVVGETGFAGTVSSELIDEIAYCNFSGRNKEQFVDNEEFVNELVRLIEDNEYYQAVASFGKDWVYENIDVAKGIDKIEDVYAENTEYFNKMTKLAMLREILRIYPSLLFDNYCNFLKSQIKKSCSLLIK